MKSTIKAHITKQETKLTKDNKPFTQLTTYSRKYKKNLKINIYNEELNKNIKEDQYLNKTIFCDTFTNSNINKNIFFSVIENKIKIIEEELRLDSIVNNKILKGEVIEVYEKNVCVDFETKTYEKLIYLTVFEEEKGTIFNIKCVNRTQKELLELVKRKLENKIINLQFIETYKKDEKSTTTYKIESFKECLSINK